MVGVAAIVLILWVEALDSLDVVRLAELMILLINAKLLLLVAIFPLIGLSLVPSNAADSLVSVDIGVVCAEVLPIVIADGHCRTVDIVLVILIVHGNRRTH